MATLLDSEAILSINDQWMELEEKWGIPVDLDTEDDFRPSMRPMFSSLDLRKTTFDSSVLLKKVRKELGRQISKASQLVDYKQFIQDLEKEAAKDVEHKDFYCINGEIMSALTVEDICDQIDHIFKSVDKLCSATSTIRQKKKPLPEIVSCSISVDDLSFDDTEKEKSDLDDVDRFIDEALQQLNDTMTNLSINESNRESVTTLVKKFTSILKSPAVNKNPRRKRECCERFRELAEFWNGHAFNNDC